MASETHNLTFHQMQMFFEDWAVDVAQYGDLTELPLHKIEFFEF